jgi:hypothetical protein
MKRRNKGTVKWKQTCKSKTKTTNGTKNEAVKEDKEQPDRQIEVA